MGKYLLIFLPIILYIVIIGFAIVAVYGYAAKKAEGLCKGAWKLALNIVLTGNRQETFTEACKRLAIGSGEMGTEGAQVGVYCGEGEGVTEFLLKYKKKIQANGDDLSQYLNWIISAANTHLSGDVAKVAAVIMHESSFDRTAVSDTGALGLGQFIFDTAKEQSVFNGQSLHDIFKIYNLSTTNGVYLSTSQKTEVKTRYGDDIRFNAEKSIMAVAEFWKKLETSNSNVKKECNALIDKADYVECVYLYGYNAACVGRDESHVLCVSGKKAAQKIKTDYIKMSSTQDPEACQGSEEGSVIGYNGVPLIKQADYKNVTYNCDPVTNIKDAGCGIVSLAMVLQYYGKDVTVAELAQLSLDNGGRACGEGTNYSFFTFAAKKYGLKNESGGTPNWDNIKNHLKNKEPVIVSGKGDAPFTSGGHFIVLVGYDEARDIVFVNDPAQASIRKTQEYSLTRVKGAYSYQIITP